MQEFNSLNETFEDYILKDMLFLKVNKKGGKVKWREKEWRLDPLGGCIFILLDFFVCCYFFLLFFFFLVISNFFLLFFFIILFLSLPVLFFLLCFLDMVGGDDKISKLRYHSIQRLEGLFFSFSFFPHHNNHNCTKNKTHFLKRKEKKN